MFFSVYNDTQKLPGNGHNQMICDYDRPPLPDKVCAVDINSKGWGPCTYFNNYSYPSASPCVFIKLNRVSILKWLNIIPWVSCMRLSAKEYKFIVELNSKRKYIFCYNLITIILFEEITVHLSFIDVWRVHIISKPWKKILIRKIINKN